MKNELRAKRGWSKDEARMNHDRQVILYFYLPISASGRKLFLNRSETGRGSQERTVSEPWENSKVKPERTPKNSTNRGRTMENECLQRSNISRFQSVLCEGYNYTPYAFTTPYRATESHYNAFWKQNYKSLLQVSILQTVWIIKATQYFIIIHNALQKAIINLCCVVNQK